MIFWQARALRLHATSLQLNATRAVVHAPRKKLNTGIGSNGNGRNATKKDLNQSAPKGLLIEKLKTAYRTLLQSSPEQSLGILKATKLQESQADAHEVQSSAEPASYIQRVTAKVPEVPVVDFLSLAICKASTKEEFFQVVKYYGHIMNKDHLLLSLKNFTKLLKIGHSPEALLATQAFQNLTEIMLIRKTLFDAHECVEIFESVCKFKLGADSPLGQGILESLRLKLKDLTLHELMQFFNVINNVEGDAPHLEVMKLVIPVLFQARHRNEIDTNNIDHCFSSLIFILISKMDPGTSEVIVDAALKVAPNFTTRQAVTVLYHAGHHALLVQKLESLRQIIVHCMEIVSDTLPEMDEQTIKQIIVSCCEHRTATKSFFDALWKLAPSWSLSQVGHLLNASFNYKSSYMTPEAAKAVTQMLIDKKSQSNEVTAVSAPLFAETIALCSRYHQPGSEGISRCMQAATVLIEAETCIEDLQKSPPDFFRFLVALSFFGVFPDSLLRKAFKINSDSESPFETSRFFLELKRQVIIHHGGELPYGIKPGMKIPFAVPPTSSWRNAPFTKALETALGDPTFFHMNVETPLGTRADYVVAMRDKNQPIHIPASKSFFGGINALPFATKVVAFLICRSGRDTFNLTEMEKLHISIRERQLQAQNLTTVVFNEAALFSLGDSDAVLRITAALERAYKKGSEYDPKFFSKKACFAARM